MYLKLIDSDTGFEMTFFIHDDEAFLETLCCILRSTYGFDIEFKLIDNKTACIVF